MTEPKRPATRAPGSGAVAGDPEDPIPQDPIPQYWLAWRHCIEASCGIRLTAAFVAERLRILGDPAQEETRRFVKSWGQAHLGRVVGWFGRCAEALAASASTGARTGPDAAGPAPDPAAAAPRRGGP